MKFKLVNVKRIPRRRTYQFNKNRGPLGMCGQEEDMDIRRGDIFYADLGAPVGSEQGGERPVLIVQNNTGNMHSPTVIAAAVTSRQNKAKLPTHVFLRAGTGNLPCDSIVLMEQVKTIDKRRLKTKVGRLNKNEMDVVDKALAVSFGVQLMIPEFEKVS